MTIKYMFKILIVSILVITFFYLSRLSLIERQIKSSKIINVISGTIDTTKYPEYRDKKFFEYGRYHDSIIFNPMMVKINNQMVQLTLEQEDYSKFIKINLDTPLNNVDFEITEVILNSGKTIQCITGLLKNNIKLINIKVIVTSEKNPVFLHCSSL